MLKDFSALVSAVKASGAERVLAVARAEDAPVIDAALRAQREGLATPIYVGETERIAALLEERGADAGAAEIVQAAPEHAGQCAAELVRDGRANILMKGLLETKDFLGPIVKKENGLRTDRIMSHIVFFELPNYHKLIMHTDGGMVMYPTLEDKRRIIENATLALRAMGYEKPRHAILCAIEKVNPKMIETVEADALACMNLSGEIKDCIVEGPISYDVAMSREIAAHKGYESPNTGDFDCLIMPNIQTGNILGKCYIVTVGAPMAGVIFGAKVPAVMASRGSDADEKFYSIAMAALIAAGLPAIGG